MSDEVKKKLTIIRRVTLGVFIALLFLCVILFVAALVTIDSGWALVALVGALLLSFVIMIPVLSFANFARFCVLKKHGYTERCYSADKILSVISASFGVLALALFALTFAPFKLSEVFMFSALLISSAALLADLVARALPERSEVKRKD